MMNNPDIQKIEELKNSLLDLSELEFAVLIGSRAQGAATETSDWDIAVRWKINTSQLDQLYYAEALKQQISDAISIHKDSIDIIDISNAKLAMRTVIAEEGLVLKGADTLAWSHFLTNTWHEIEDFYWRKSHAA